MHPAFITPLPLFPRTARRHAPARTPRRPRQLPLLAAKQDHYKVLDVPETADPNTIKRAYRRAALKNHPDVSNAPDARERFMRVQEAYAVLSDPSKRAAYDRRKASPFGPSGIPGFDGFNPDFAKQWREKNPMPEDIDDSLGSILSDLVSGVVANAVVGSNTVVDDFVEFLENQVDGFRDDGLSDILNSRDVDVLETELEDSQFVLKQLKSRKLRAEEEADSLRERASQWRVRAERAENKREYDVRDAARERQRELTKEADRFTDRARKTARMMEDQEDRIRKISDRLDQVRLEQPNPATTTGKAATTTGKAATTTGKAADPQKSQQEAIDEELEKMKKEMGL